ncbi:MAG: 50S ribosomal protein L22 [Clostridia bacterium]|jgi:large subunit ribosomal protein L22|nr:50S ribosomal protein L22 [Clostridia bacterium]MBQ7914241.1 50S ribosomal protein L22 [Clostridia bacterium]MBQ8504657.1 50S ribosomal protein L22 [Clostridia bacterium]MBQ8772806.1 50S ribosomal protein L22 [Clostridia bacterium]MBQ8872692.1 50S ribosomal protein L22 [Clostridia bacterium]
MATRSKQKALVRAENKDRRPKAIAKYIRISPSKVHVVLDLIRGKNYKDAVAILKTTAKAAAEPVLKCMNSAAANAEVNLGMNKDTLYVAECFADQGPTLKRMQPVSRGRGYRILKRTSHITVILDERA